MRLSASELHNCLSHYRADEATPDLHIPTLVHWKGDAQFGLHWPRTLAVSIHWNGRGSERLDRSVRCSAQLHRTKGMQVAYCPERRAANGDISIGDARMVRAVPIAGGSAPLSFPRAENTRVRQKIRSRFRYSSPNCALLDHAPPQFPPPSFCDPPCCTWVRLDALSSPSLPRYIPHHMHVSGGGRHTPLAQGPPPHSIRCPEPHHALTHRSRSSQRTRGLRLSRAPPAPHRPRP